MHVPCCVLGGGHLTAAAALAAVECPPELAAAFAMDGMNSSFAVVAPLAEYRRVGSHALHGAPWTWSDAEDTLVVLTLDSTGYGIACGVGRYARIDAGEAEAVARDFERNTGRRWFVIARTSNGDFPSTLLH